MTVAVKLFPVNVAAALLAAASICAAAPALAAGSAHGPANAPGPRAGEVVPDRYIVVFRPGTRDAPGLSRRLAREHGAELRHVYEHALQGFAARVPDGRVDALRRDPHVASVEPDTVATATDTQSGATWGLDRIDQRSLPLDGLYSDGNEGAGVHAYVIDTGIRLTHGEFSGRIGNGYDAVTAGGSANDCNGHGTHVAGTAGGTVYGVADKVVLHAVRVLGCNGSGAMSGVIAGVDWVKANAIRPAVANMSLGGSVSDALDSAVASAISSGITFAVAAGNSNANACNTSPARVAAAITVGATTSTDSRSSFSNYGSCLDLFAPGSSITSAWHTGDSATNTISGTSMASPHAAGVAALKLAASPSATPAQVRDAIVADGTQGQVTNAGSGSPNVLLYNGVGSPPPPPPPPASELIVNGGFESGSTGWTQSSSGGYELISTAKPRTGSYGVWEGGYNNAKDSIGQSVTLPANASLRYHWQMTSDERGSTADDHLRVQLLDASSGALIATLRSWSNRDTRGAWSLDTIGLGAYAGRSVRVQFATTTDSTKPTSFFIDDVSLEG